MFETIVVGTDGSDTAARAVEVAARIAAENHSVLHVVTAHRARSSAPAGGGAPGGAGAFDLGFTGLQADETLSAVAEQLGRDDVRAETHSVAGPAADALLGVAGEVGADLIVVGSLGMTGARRVLGSVPNSVAHGASCSVLIVKTD